MPPNNPKPITPKLRGERWELHDGRKVVLLEFLGRTFVGRVLQVINDRNLLEAVHESQFKKRLYPSEGDKKEMTQ